MIGVILMNKDTIISSRSQLVQYFERKEKEINEWKIGTEHEKFIFSLDNFHPVPYKGKNGIESLLYSLQENSGWKPKPAIPKFNFFNAFRS